MWLFYNIKLKNLEALITNIIEHYLLSLITPIPNWVIFPSYKSFSKNQFYSSSHCLNNQISFKCSSSKLVCCSQRILLILFTTHDPLHTSIYNHLLNCMNAFNLAQSLKYWLYQHNCINLLNISQWIDFDSHYHFLLIHHYEYLEDFSSR